MAVTYVNTANGASIIYKTSDRKLIVAIHDWFAAQIRRARHDGSIINPISGGSRFAQSAFRERRPGRSVATFAIAAAAFPEQQRTKARFLNTALVVISLQKERSMRRQSLLRILAAAGGTAFGVLTWPWRSRDAVAAQTSMDDMMGGGMMSSVNMNGPMRTGMQLFQRHGEVRRTVTEVAGGVHAVSESDDPHTASLLQEHVSEMYARLDQDRTFPYPMSRSVPAMFANSTRYRRKLSMLPKGIAVTETAEDAGMVEIIRAHARGINGFVNDGMPAMMRNMMQ